MLASGMGTMALEARRLWGRRLNLPDAMLDKTLRRFATAVLRYKRA